MPTFGTNGVTESSALPVGAGDISNPFKVPQGFTGHVYIHGIGGDHTAIFEVGSDGDGTLLQKIKTSQTNMPHTDIERTANKLEWHIIGVPTFGLAGTKISVALVGVSMANQA